MSAPVHQAEVIGRMNDMAVPAGRFVATLIVPGRVESIRPAACFLVEAARNLKVPAAANPLFEVAIVEALNNAVRHNARANDEALQCDFELSGRTLIIRIVDEAARAPLAVSLPTTAPSWPGSADAWADVPDSGYGLYLIQAVFQSLRPIESQGRHGVELELSY